MRPDLYTNPYFYIILIGSISFVAFIFRISARFFKSTPENIIIAVKRFRYDYINDYLEMGGNINIRNKTGRTILMIAADKGWKSVRKSVILGTATGNSMDKTNPGPYSATLELIEYLLSNGADPNLKDKDGQTALFFAADSPDRVNLLLKAGADINAQNNDGQTVLIRAAQIGEYYIVKDFLEKGADPRIMDNAGKIAIDYALEDERRENIVKLLEKVSRTTRFKYTR